MARVELVTAVAAPRGRCFDLARSVDAHVHSTRGTGERAIAGRLNGLLTLHEEVTWRARHLGFSLTLTSRITAFDLTRHFRRFLEVRNRELKSLAESEAWRQFVPQADG